MTCDYRTLPHIGIQTLSPYVPGKSAESLAHEQGIMDVIKLASNENPLGCSPKVIKALQKLSPHTIATYPSAATHPLRAVIAELHGLTLDNITLANGSDMLFNLLIHAFALHRGKHILTHAYAFIMYKIFAKSLGVPIIETPLTHTWQVDCDALLSACNADTALIFLANPNNPTGSYLPHEKLRTILQTIPSTTLLVLDEAYYEYHSNDNHSIYLLNAYPNLIITRTFSKAYGLAGLRLGYAFANPSITDILHRILLPFSVSQAALTAASAAIKDKEFIHKTIADNQAGLQQLSHGLKALKYDFLPPAGNFITVFCHNFSNALYTFLLKHGIIVRPLAPYGMEQYLRITIGTKQQNQRLLDTLNQFSQ